MEEPTDRTNQNWDSFGITVADPILTRAQPPEARCYSYVYVCIIEPSSEPKPGWEPAQCAMEEQGTWVHRPTLMALTGCSEFP